MAVFLPDWPRPANVRIALTDRLGGVSAPPYDSFNLGFHVGDREASVAENRRRLYAGAGLAREPRWLSQVHGVDVVAAETAVPGTEADGSHCRTPGLACAVLTADCLPVLLWDDVGSVVAACHAGWRGLAAGVVGATIAALAVAPSRLSAGLGPAIGPGAFEVGGEVRDAFLSPSFCGDARDAVLSAFTASDRPEHWRADLYGLARVALARAGVGRVYGGNHCTVSEPERFFSYRRDGRTGRMASLVWLA